MSLSLWDVDVIKKGRMAISLFRFDFNNLNDVTSWRMLKDHLAVFLQFYTTLLVTTLLENMDEVGQFESLLHNVMYNVSGPHPRF